jgi:hypothetical protein
MKKDVLNYTFAMRVYKKKIFIFIKTVECPVN